MKVNDPSLSEGTLLLCPIPHLYLHPYCWCPPLVFFFLSILHGSALWCECHPEHLDLIFSRKLMRYIEISGIRKELWSIRVVYSESAVQLLVLTRLSKAKNGKSRFTWSLSLNLFQLTMHHWHRGTHRQHAQTLRPQGEVFCKCFLLTIFLTESFSSSNTRTNHLQSDWVRGNQAAVSIVVLGATHHVQYIVHKSAQVYSTRRPAVTLIATLQAFKFCWFAKQVPSKGFVLILFYLDASMLRELEMKL